MDERSAIEGRIHGLLIDILRNTASDLDIPAERGLREAGVSSASLIALLVQMEEEFDFEWDDDTPPEVFRSISTLSEFVHCHAQSLKEVQ